MAPHCPVCRELWQIKFYHLLSHLSQLINIAASFFSLPPLPVPALPAPDISNTHLWFILTTGSFFIYIQLTVSRTDLRYKCNSWRSLHLQTANITPCHLSRHWRIKAAAPWQWLRHGAPLSRIRARLMWGEKKVVSLKVWNMRPQLVLGVTHVQSPVRNKESGFFHRGLFQWCPVEIKLEEFYVVFYVWKFIFLMNKFQWVISVYNSVS